MKRTNIHLTEQQLKILTSQSKHDGLPMAEHIRRAVDKYIQGLVTAQALDRAMITTMLIQHQIPSNR